MRIGLSGEELSDWSSREPIRPKDLPHGFSGNYISGAQVELRQSANKTSIATISVTHPESYLRGEILA